tara:strand:+ start:2924 stop:3316 length:393 start_codon:yes stop_codon:yes gene_type:complete
MANANIETTGNSIVMNTRLWAGTNNESTAWLDGIAGVGAGDAEGAPCMLVVDLKVTAHNTITTFDLGLMSELGLSKVSGNALIAVLGVINLTNQAHVPTLITQDGDTAGFTTANNAAVADDIHRVTILYR